MKIVSDFHFFKVLLNNKHKITDVIFLLGRQKLLTIGKTHEGRRKDGDNENNSSHVFAACGAKRSEVKAGFALHNALLYDTRQRDGRDGRKYRKFERSEN